MASFDLETFLKVQSNTGTGAFQALGMAYGMPSCLINLGKEALALLPTNILNEVGGSIASGKAKANEFTKEVFKKLSFDTGIIEFDTEQGRIKFKSISSLIGGDSDSAQFLDDLGGALAAFQFAASFGSQLYSNYQDIAGQLDAISDCLDKFKSMQSFQSGNSANAKGALSAQEQEDLLNQKYGADIQKLNEANTFIKSCNDKLDEINQILAEREADPSKEPKFLDSRDLDPYLSGTSYDRYPFEDPNLERPDDVFRLIYGPPISQDGQYVLTSDGLYYDSKSGGLDPIYLAISGVVPVGDRWQYEYDPNLGGKGSPISIKSLNKFTDNIFDPERIDDSLGMEAFYGEDHMLSVLRQQRNKHVYDLSAELTQMITEFGEDSSITKNQRQIIISEVANHNSKINRRKKQIEVAVKAPQIYGDASGSQFKPGEIPINDFSFLEDYNLVVDLEKQKALIFEQAEVNGIVLPVKPKFVKSPPKPPSLTYEHLNVPSVGKGSILYSSPADGSATVLSLNDQITNDGLFAIYNFLEPDVALPSSVDFQTTNCATPDMYNNAKLVAPNKQDVFFSGLGIPYFRGVTRHKDYYPAAASGLGSYMRLPDTPEFRDLTYDPNGFSIDFWLHVPNIRSDTGWTRDRLNPTPATQHKVILACENTGSKVDESAKDHTGQVRGIDYLKNDRGDQYTRGMLFGLSRDRRMTDPSSAFDWLESGVDNDATVLYIAPTQARDGSGLGFINNDDCQDYPTFHKMTLHLSSNDALGRVDQEFVHVCVTTSPYENEIKFYIDGDLATTSAISAVFGVEPNKTINLPSFKKPNSFEYSTSSVDGPTTLQQGPKLNRFYTPWIVGGGYTDGMSNNGNFMGGGYYGGFHSGLHGHLGSLKFYAKPLDRTEVKQNYEAQRGFFKNIKV